MYKNICKRKSNIEGTNVAASFRLRHEVGEAHHAITQQEHCALVHHLHSHGEVRFEGPKRK